MRVATWHRRIATLYFVSMFFEQIWLDIYLIFMEGSHDSF